MCNFLNSSETSLHFWLEFNFSRRSFTTIIQIIRYESLSATTHIDLIVKMIHFNFVWDMHMVPTCMCTRPGGYSAKLAEKILPFVCLSLKKATPFTYFHSWPVSWKNCQKRKSSCHFHEVPNKENDIAIRCVCSQLKAPLKYLND